MKYGHEVKSEDRMQHFDKNTEPIQDIIIKVQRGCLKHIYIKLQKFEITK